MNTSEHLLDPMSVVGAHVDLLASSGDVCLRGVRELSHTNGMSTLSRGFALLCGVPASSVLILEIFGSGVCALSL